MSWLSKWINRVRGRAAVSAEGKRLLLAIAQGWTLKSHRYLDGQKEYKLWSPEGETEEIAYELVQSLIDQKFITTNQKFPAATFLLTNKGKAFVENLDQGIQGIADIVHFDS